MRRSLFASLVSLVIVCIAGTARADGYDFRPHDRPSLGVAVRMNRIQQSIGDAPGMYGGGAYVHGRLLDNLAMEMGFEGFGGSLANGYLSGGYGYTLAPNFLVYPTAKSRFQPYAIFGWSLEGQFFGKRDDIPKEARPGFIYSGPTLGAGLDLHVDRHWALRFEVRGFYRIRGYPDDKLQENPEFERATRHPSGFIFSTGALFLP